MQASKSIYYIQDYSGSIEVILWKDQVHGHEVFHQGSHVRVIGRARYREFSLIQFYLGFLLCFEH